MRLIGSLTEDRLREGLLNSNAALRDDHGDSALSAVLRDQGVDLARAYVLHWLPEQSEEIYTILDGDRRVLTIELPREKEDGPPIVETVSYADFRVAISKRSRITRLKFAIAADLVSRTSGVDS